MKKTSSFVVLAALALAVAVPVFADTTALSNSTHPQGAKPDFKNGKPVGLKDGAKKPNTLSNSTHPQGAKPDFKNGKPNGDLKSKPDFKNGAPAEFKDGMKNDQPNSEE